VAVELLDNPIYESAPNRRATATRLLHGSRRAAGRLAIPGGSCRRRAAVAGLAVRPASAPIPADIRVPLDIQVPLEIPVTRAPGAGARGSGRPANRRAPYRLRQVVALGALAVVVAVVVACSWLAIRTALGRIGGGPLATTGAPGGSQGVAVRVWIVRPGDTLWAIAEAIDPNGDVRPLVDRLASEAHGSAIYPGESIAIPGR
jgi:hypothetical protein